MELVVERVDALDDDGLARADFQGSALDPVPLLEIETGQGHFLAGDEVQHVLVEKGDVEAVDVLVIGIAVLIERHLGLGTVIIVDRDADRVDAAGHELDAEAVRERGLAGARGARDADEADVLDVVLDELAELGDHAVVSSFAEVDVIDGAELLDLVVDAGDGRGIDDLGPVVAFLEDPVEGRGVLEFGDLPLAFRAGVLEQHTGGV